MYLNKKLVYTNTRYFLEASLTLLRGIAYFSHGQETYLQSIGPFSGLGNGYSITKNDLDESDCLFAFICGHPCDDWKYRPLANIIFNNFRSSNYTEDSSNGWVVSDV